MRSNRDKVLIALGIVVGLSLAGYTIYWLATPRAFTNPASHIQHGMSPHDVRRVMGCPPGRYRTLRQSFAGEYPGRRPTEPGVPSYSIDRWEGRDVRVVVGYDDHGRVNNVWVDPAR